MEPYKSIKILLVEDSKADQLYFRSVLNAADITADLHIAGTAAEVTPDALQTLQPDIVLLDLYLQPVSGKELLDEIKKHEALKNIPIVVLTGSTHENDIEQCYQKGAYMYVVKEQHLEKNLQNMKELFSINWKEQRERPARENFVFTSTASLIS